MSTPISSSSRRRSRVVALVLAAVALALLVTAFVGNRARGTASASDSSAGPAVGEIYQLQAAFHRAKTNQDLDLMMSLWAPDAHLTAQGDPPKNFDGSTALRTYWSGTGSFKNRRLSLVPSFKTQVRVDGDSGYLYFECHDVADYDLSTRSIVNDTFLAGTVRRVKGHWVFADMTSGKAPILSADRYYYP